MASAQIEKERDVLLAQLRKSRDHYLKLLKGINDETAKKTPADGGWSILQIAEHVLIAERQMLNLWIKYAVPGKSDPTKDDSVARGIVDRSRKDMAPETSVPKGKVLNMAQAFEQFDFYRGQTIGYVEATEEDFRMKVVKHPIAGEIDGYQLFLLMAGHSERHAAQIEEVKSKIG